MKMILLAYLAICFSVCFFKKTMPIVLAVGFGMSWYLFFYGNKPAGLLLFLFLCLAATLFKVAVRGGLPASRTETGRKERHVRSSVAKVWYLIPLFWPLLIARALLGDRVHKTDMGPYDYEQHLKSNAR